MRIAMFTNTYLPMVGGVSISIHQFAEALRAQGHAVLIVAPEYDGQAEDEEHVVRVAALRNFNHSAFSIPLPVKFDLSSIVEDFAPDIIHAHHPFFLGDTALRMAGTLARPIVTTHHTHYGQYLHYLPGDADWLAEFVDQLCIQHANLCDAVIAPSRSVEAELKAGGVQVPIHIIPTGIDLARYQQGDRDALRARHGFTKQHVVLGHVGRLAPEKNLAFLARAFCSAMAARPETRCLIVGDGPTREEMESIFTAAGLMERTVFTGTLGGSELAGAYHAMDVFGFSSQSETQGIVVAEALAAGAPVVALSAPGVDDVVRDQENGRLLPEEDEAAFVAAIGWVIEAGEALRAHVPSTIRAFSIEATTAKLLALYETAIAAGERSYDLDNSEWDSWARRLQAEWDIWTKRVEAMGNALRDEDE